MKKALIITGIILTVSGIRLVAAAIAISAGDFSLLTAKDYKTSTYTTAGDFSNISIESKETNIEFKLSADSGVSVVCTEKNRLGHTVTTQNGTLKIADIDEREWYDYFSFFSQNLTMTVYLPKTQYESIKVDSHTGNIRLDSPFSFTNAEVKASTGNVTVSAGVSEKLNVKTSTGNIKIKNTKAGKMELSVSTGNILAESVECEGDISVNVSTGKTEFYDVTCKNFYSNGSTGNITVKDVVASGQFEFERSTGNVRFDNSDAENISVKTSTGNVTGTLRTKKVFITDSSTGRINVPETTSGGRCKITTSTGNIDIKLSNIE